MSPPPSQGRKKSAKHSPATTLLSARMWASHLEMQIRQLNQDHREATGKLKKKYQDVSDRLKDSERRCALVESAKSNMQLELATETSRSRELENRNTELALENTQLKRRTRTDEASKETAFAQRQVAEMQHKCARVEEDFEKIRVHNLRLWAENAGLSAALAEARDSFDATQRDFETRYSSLVVAKKQVERQVRTDASAREINIAKRKVEGLETKCADAEACCERLREAHKRGREENAALSTALLYAKQQVSVLRGDVETSATAHAMRLQQRQSLALQHKSHELKLLEEELQEKYAELLDGEKGLEAERNALRRAQRKLEARGDELNKKLKDLSAGATIEQLQARIRKLNAEKKDFAKSLTFYENQDVENKEASMQAKLSLIESRVKSESLQRCFRQGSILSGSMRILCIQLLLARVSITMSAHLINRFMWYMRPDAFVGTEGCVLVGRKAVEQVARFMPRHTLVHNCAYKNKHMRTNASARLRVCVFVCACVGVCVCVCVHARACVCAV